MNAPERPKIEHKPYRKPIPAPGRPAAASKPPPPGRQPPGKKPRKRPLEAEIRHVVEKAKEEWVAEGLRNPGKLECGAGVFDFIVKAITKRLHGCHVPAQRRDRVAKRLPAPAFYAKYWDGEKWLVTLYLPIGPNKGSLVFVSDDDGKVEFFESTGSGSFLTEQNADKLYRKWKREQEGPK